MAVKADLVPRAKIGFYTLLQRVHSSKKKSASIRKQWRVACVCGRHETIPEMYLLRPGNPKTHCGCQNPVSNKTKFNNEYRIWTMIQQRCYNDNHVSYKDYGGRGIHMYPAWQNWDTGFDEFLKFVGPRPSLGHSIDRVDVDGNYEPYHPITGAIQVKWATAKEQAQNTRAKKAERLKNEVRDASPKSLPSSKPETPTST